MPSVARAASPRGEVSLCRRDDDVLELRVNGVFVMDTAETSSERALARVALAAVARPARVLVGGLGLGFTAAEVLADDRVAGLDVVEIEQAVLDWLSDGTVPHGPALLADARLTVHIDDVLSYMSRARAASYDVVLLDVDNGPDQLVHLPNRALYERAGLAVAAACARARWRAGGLECARSTCAGVRAAHDDRVGAHLSRPGSARPARRGVLGLRREAVASCRDQSSLALSRRGSGGAARDLTPPPPFRATRAETSVSARRHVRRALRGPPERTVMTIAPPLEGAARARTSDLHVTEVEELPSPRDLTSELPSDDVALRRVETSREAVRACLDGIDDRLLVIVGPCSIHDPSAGLDYARRLAALAERLQDRLLIVMRTYFEKPRTTVGWKGLVNDPHLDGSHDIATGLRRARGFLRDVVGLGLPTATEWLEPISPQYLADLVSWGAIGARTAESQIHRQLASGLSMPVGFKNGTDGSLDVAVDGCAAAAAAQSFLGIAPDGRAALVRTSGNPDAHLILRGSSTGPNYGPAQVAAAAARLRAAGMPARLLVDASHGNSGKDHHRQEAVAHELAEQIARQRSDGEPTIAGVMLESFLVDGSQRLDPRPDHPALVYGRSVTDACLSWETTVGVLEHLAAAVTGSPGTGSAPAG